MPSIPDAGLVRRQLKTIASPPDRFAEAFGRRLAQECPASVERDDAPIAGLGDIVAGAGDPDAFLVGLMTVSRRFSASDSRAESCTAAGVALLNALADVIGESFDSRAREAWSLAFVLAADLMSEAT